MFSFRNWQKLSPVTATTALSIAALTTIAALPAQAVQLQTFKISGTFGDEGFANNEYVSERLANGYFEGTYTVDVDQLPTNSYVSFTDWDVTLFSSTGDEQGGFAPTDFTPVSYTSGGVSTFNGPRISFVGYRDPRMYLYIDDNFTGVSTGRAVDVGLGVPIYGVFGFFYDGDDSRIYVTSFRSEPLNNTVAQTVPEPATLTGVLATFALGWLVKRKQKVTQLG
jgi:hypothetical protein